MTAGELEERQQPPHPLNGVRIVDIDVALVVNGEQLIVGQAAGGFIK